MMEETFDKKDVEDNKIIAALAYLWVLFLVPLLLRRKSPFAQVHAKQGLVLFLVQAISSLFIWVPIAGQLWSLLIFLVVPLVAVVRTASGMYWEIPVLGNYAKRISFD